MDKLYQLFNGIEISENYFNIAKGLICNASLI